MSPARILIVEDESIVARDLQEQLAKAGYLVVGVTARGDEALRLTAELEPNLVLMDIRLQGELDGIAAAAALRERCPAAVIFLTAHADTATLERARVTEPFGYLLKPFDERELRTTIEMALYKHSAEQRLRESERRLATTLASIGEGVIAYDVTGCITFANPVAERLTGWPATEVVGRPFAEILKTRLEDGGEVLVSRHGGECFIEKSLAPMLDERGARTGDVLTFRDVTETRRLQRHLQQTHTLESIGRLAAGLAHDFNNLLTVILCNARLLNATIGTDAAGEALREIEQAAETGARLTRRLLAFGRQSTAQLRVLDLNRLIEDHKDPLQRLIGDLIHLALHLEPGLGPVRGDPAQLGQVLMNLAVNARDAMPHGGTLRVETADVFVNAPSAETPPDLLPGRYRMLAIADTGHGMDKATMARIFEPFFTTKDHGKGTGLGLATVHGIVQQCQGRIWVTSELERGTTFRIFLPHVSGPVEPPREPDLTSLPEGSETLLLVEDDDATRRVCAAILRACGYQVLQASSGAEALKIEASHCGPLHLLLTDLIMPEMSGAALAQQLQARRPELKVLCMSGHPDPSRIIQDDRVQVLAKPFTAAILAHALRQVLDHGEKSLV